MLQCGVVLCFALQCCFALCCSVVQCDSMHYNVLQCEEVCGIVLQCVLQSVLQCVAVAAGWRNTTCVLRIGCVVCSCVCCSVSGNMCCSVCCWVCCRVCCSVRCSKPEICGWKSTTPHILKRLNILKRALPGWKETNMYEKIQTDQHVWKEPNLSEKSQTCLKRSILVWKECGRAWIVWKEPYLSENSPGCQKRAILVWK